MVLPFIVKCLLFIFSSVVLYNIWLIATKYRIYWFSLTQNGGWLPLLPLVGNAYMAILTGVKVNMLCTSLWAERYLGMPTSFWYGNKYHYFTKSSEETRIVINHPKCLNKAEIYNDMKWIFGNSILLASENDWKGKRRFFRSAFNTNMINSYIPTFYQQSCILLDLIKEKNPEEDHYKFFNVHTFLSFFFTSVGWFPEGNTDATLFEIAHCVDKGQEEFLKIFANPILPTWIWARTPLGAKLRFYKMRGESLLDDILQKKRAEMAKNSEYLENTSKLPLMELLYNDGYECKDNSEILEEYCFLAAAATDTTGHTLTFTFAMLGMFPDVQQKLYEEVISVAENGEFDEVMLSKLVYTEAVIHETMRLFPPAPIMGRLCLEDVDLGDKIVPKGTNILMSIYHIQRSPEYWDDPLKFDPTRFLPENSGKIKPATFLPFSSGPRNCLGLRMAITLLKTTVATVVRDFKITSIHRNINELKLTSCITMKTRNHLDLHFIPRSENVQ